MISTLVARHPRLLVSLLMAFGAIILIWGMPRAKQYRLPWRWRIGVLWTGLGLVFWPPFYYWFGHIDLEMVWIPIWFATLYTFMMGFSGMLGANKWKPLGGVHHPYDAGWVMRPHPKSPSKWDSLERMHEDFSNPTAAALRRMTSTEPDVNENNTGDDLREDDGG
jgi:hypothetical protein